MSLHSLVFETSASTIPPPRLTRVDVTRAQSASRPDRNVRPMSMRPTQTQAMLKGQYRTVPLPSGSSVRCRVIEGVRASKPTFLLLHGMFGDGEYNWGPHADEVARHGRVIIPNLRGHEPGGICEGPWLMHDAMEEMVELCKALGAPCVVPVGLSLGGAVAQLIWLKHSDLVAGYILAMTAARFPVNLPARLGIEAAAKLADSSPDALRTLPISSMMAEIIKQRSVGAKSPHPAWTAKQIPLMLQIVREASRFNALPFVRTISVPTEVIAIKEDDVVGTRNSVELARLIPGAKLQLLPRPADGLSPHCCPERGTKEFHSALLTAVDRIAREICA